MNENRYHLVREGDGGYTKPLYADEWGNIVSEEEVERQRLIDNVATAIKAWKNRDVCSRCKADMQGNSKCPYCGNVR